jgi:hypothetical protein
MDYKTYLVESKRTLSIYFNIDTDGKSLDCLSPDTLHAIMGISTEVAELYNPLSLARKDFTPDVITNIIEEFGDLSWFMAILVRMYNLEVSTNLAFDIEPSKTPRQVYELLNEHASAMLDLAKKSLFYNKPLDVKSISRHTVELQRVIIYFFTHLLEIPLERVYEANIHKLYVRYPDKFTPDCANFRNLSAEIAALENYSK